MHAQGLRENPSLMRRLQARETPPAWSLATAFVFVVAYIVLLIAGQLMVITLSGSSVETPLPRMLSIGALLGSLVTAGGVAQWARRRFQSTWIDNLRLRPAIKPPLFAVVLFSLGAAWAIDLVGVLLKLKGDDVVPPLLGGLNGPISVAWVLAAVLAVFVQPLAEGLVFAGVLYPALAHLLRNNVIASIAVAVVYTLISAVFLSTGAGLWYALIQPFLMALVMVLIRAYSQSAQSAIVSRALFGLFFVLAALINLRSY